MSVMKKVWARAESNLRSQTGRKKSKNRAGIIVGTDFGKDMNLLFEDLSNRKIKAITDKMSTAVRKAIVAELKRGSSGSRIGMSQYNKMTRGDWKNPKSSSEGYNYLPGGWAGEVLDKRGAAKPSMAFNGGAVEASGKGRGDRGIITKNIKRRGGGYSSITGPRYSADDSDNGKYGYNYAHILEYGGKHVNWGGKRGQNSKPLPARPFMAPAYEKTKKQNMRIAHTMMEDWTNGK